MIVRENQEEKWEWIKRILSVTSGEVCRELAVMVRDREISNFSISVMPQTRPHQMARKLKIKPDPARLSSACLTIQRAFG